MIEKSTLTFLANLAANNHREWFQDNKPAYEHAKANFIEYTAELITEVSKFDPAIASTKLEAKSLVSRLHRDVRFSKDKTPYKTNFFAIIGIGGKKGHQAAYYIQIQPGLSFAGGGAYFPMPEHLALYRQEIDYNFAEFESIINKETFTKVFSAGVQAPERLSRPPKGFEATNPAIEFMKMKGYYALASMPDTELTSEQTSLILREVYPLVRFLNQAF